MAFINARACPIAWQIGSPTFLSFLGGIIYGVLLLFVASIAEIVARRRQG